MTKLLSLRFLQSYYTLAVLLSINWFLPSLDSILFEESLSGRLEIVGYVALMVALQLFAYFLITRFYRGPGARYVSAFVFAGILAVNLLAFLLSFYEPFLAFGEILNAAAVTVCFLVLFFLRLLMDRKPAIAAGVSLVYMLLIVQQIVTVSLPQDESGGPVGFDQFKIVQFKDKPSVYLMAFDAFMTEVHAKQFLGFDKLHYAETLKANGARLIRNVFSDYDFTQFSLNSMLYMDPDVFDSVSHRVPALSGLRPAPVLSIFRSNGYKINTGRGGRFMPKGPYVDEFTPSGRTSAYCTFALQWFYMQHLGYCIAKRAIIERYIYRSRTVKRLSYLDEILENFDQRALSEQPWLNFLYVLLPQHTPKSFTGTKKDFDQYRERTAKTDRRAAAFIQKVFDHVKTKDPNSILLILGDHGPWMTRTKEMTQENKVDLIRDRHAVTAAIYPPDACKDYVGVEEGETFVTNDALVRQIITCLADGDDPVDWDVDYSGPFREEGFELGDAVYQ